MRVSHCQSWTMGSSFEGKRGESKEFIPAVGAGVTCHKRCRPGIPFVACGMGSVSFLHCPAHPTTGHPSFILRTQEAPPTPCPTHTQSGFAFSGYILQKRRFVFMKLQFTSHMGLLYQSSRCPPRDESLIAQWASTSARGGHANTRVSTKPWHAVCLLSSSRSSGLSPPVQGPPTVRRESCGVVADGRQPRLGRGLVGQRADPNEREGDTWNAVHPLAARGQRQLSPILSSIAGSARPRPIVYPPQSSV